MSSSAFQYDIDCMVVRKYHESVKNTTTKISRLLPRNSQPIEILFEFREDAGLVFDLRTTHAFHFTPLVYRAFGFIRSR